MSNDMLECAARLRRLVSLNEPRNGGPYQGFAAEMCMDAMREAASILEYEGNIKHRRIVEQVALDDAGKSP